MSKHYQFKQLNNPNQVMLKVVRKVFPTLQAIKIYRHWYSHYAKREDMDVITLVREMSEKFAWNAHMQRIFYHTLRAYFPAVEEHIYTRKPLITEPEVEASTLIAPAPPKTTKNTPCSDENIVFTALYRELMPKVSNRSTHMCSEIIEIIIEQVEQENIASIDAVAIARWGMYADANTPPILASVASKAKFIHFFYIALCESLGPSEADRLLNQARRTVLNSVAAHAFSPDQFL